MNAQIPEGWYSDPDKPGSERYWDGERWTTKVRIAAIPAAEAPPTPATSPASTPPGWYPDPQKPKRQRYWDGTKWTSEKEVVTKGSGFVAAYRRLPKWVQIGIPVLAVIVIIAAVAGGSDDKSEQASGSASSGSTSVETTSTSASESDHGNPSENASDSNTPSVGPNGSVEVDTLRWRLDGARATKTIGDTQYGLGATANAIFVIVELSVKNNKSETVTLTPEMIELTATGKDYSPDNKAEFALATTGANTFLIEDLGPGVALHGKTAFDVPPAVLKERPQLRFKELGFGTTHGYIALPPLSPP